MKFCVPKTSGAKYIYRRPSSRFMKIRPSMHLLMSLMLRIKGIIKNSSGWSAGNTTKQFSKNIIGLSSVIVILKATPCLSNGPRTKQLLLG